MQGDITPLSLRTSWRAMRAISEEELGHLRAQQYTAISDKQTLIDERLQAEQQEQREKIDTDISSQRGHQNAMMVESNPGAQLQSMKGQEEVMRNRRLPSDMATVMPKVENNSEFTSQTSSTNNEDLDLEWDSEDGGRLPL
ncbi:hypothetical protein Z043_120262 [Scleropages formosus]|uniref:Uncharacterized protein n=1 Tax=Scleropages formosus TaxID=113540 RepID=A0A0P7WKI3_SCLFO|nr:hypothetical protein Z043_120262 [Scleropages formosus]